MFPGRCEGLLFNVTVRITSEEWATYHTVVWFLRIKSSSINGQTQENLIWLNGRYWIDAIGFYSLPFWHLCGQDAAVWFILARTQLWQTLKQWFSCTASAEKNILRKERNMISLSRYLHRQWQNTFLKWLSVSATDTKLQLDTCGGTCEMNLRKLFALTHQAASERDSDECGGDLKTKILTGSEGIDKCFYLSL